MLFQALEVHRDSISTIYEAQNDNRQKFNSDVEYLKGLLSNVVEDFESVYIVVDGLDEIEEVNRKPILKMLLEVVDLCGNIRFLLSSRREHDILRALDSRAVSLMLNEKNLRDIEKYVEVQRQEWSEELRTYGCSDSDSDELKSELEKVAVKSGGIYRRNWDETSILTSSRDVPLRQTCY